MFETCSNHVTSLCKSCSIIFETFLYHIPVIHKSSWYFFCYSTLSKFCFLPIRSSSTSASRHQFPARDTFVVVFIVVAFLVCFFVLCLIKFVGSFSVLWLLRFFLLWYGFGVVMVWFWYCFRIIVGGIFSH